MMNSYQNQLPNSIEQARDLLSLYIDDEVTTAERELVEAMLAQSPDLQVELESLQQTVALVNNMPRVPAPRPFTLTERDVDLPRLKRGGSFRAWFKPFMGAAAALAAVFVVGILFILNSSPGGQEAGQVALAPAAPKVMKQGKMEANTAEHAVERQQTSAPAEKPAAEMKNSVPVAGMVETEKEGESAPSFAETTLSPEPTIAPLLETEIETPSGVERVAADSADPLEEAAEAEYLSETGPVAPAGATLEEMSAPMGASAGASKSLGEVTATVTRFDDAEEQAASEAVTVTESTESIALVVEAHSTPATTTLFIPLAAQKRPINAESAAPPTPASVSPETPPGGSARQTQPGAMALAIGLVVAGLVLVVTVAILLIIRNRK